MVRVSPPLTREPIRTREVGRPVIRSTQRRWLLAILSLVAGVSQAAPPARWTILNLGDMAGGIGGSTALAINNRGEIAGYATAASDRSRFVALPRSHHHWRT